MASDADVVLLGHNDDGRNAHVAKERAGASVDMSRANTKERRGSMGDDFSDIGSEASAGSNALRRGMRFDNSDRSPRLSPFVGGQGGAGAGMGSGSGAGANHRRHGDRSPSKASAGSPAAGAAAERPESAPSASNNPTGAVVDRSGAPSEASTPASAEVAEAAPTRPSTSIFTSAAARGGGGSGPASKKGKLRGPLKRLHKEFMELQALSETSDGTISGGPRGDDFYHWNVRLIGPQGTPYEGGHFNVEVTFPADYPFKPPTVNFKTRIYHCNITPKGICMEVLKDGWSPRVTLAKVIIELMSLLTDPSASTPLDGAIAKLYMDDRAEHDKVAREWTARYAAPEPSGSD